MVVPVSLRPDRREQTYVKGRGWVHYTETREYQRKKQREEREAARAEAYRKNQERLKKEAEAVAGPEETDKR